MNETPENKRPIDIPDDDLPRLFENTVQDLEKAFGIAISVHDRLGLLTNNAGYHLLPERKTHMHPYCLYKRFEKRHWSRRCVTHCKFYVNHIMRQEGHSAALTCWKGVTELTVPFFQDDLHIMTIYAGAFRGECPTLDKLPVELQELHAKLPVLDDEKKQTLERVIYMLGCAVLRILDREQKHHIAPSGRKAVIARCMEQNAHIAGFSIKDLAAELNLSPSRTSHLVRELFNESFQYLLLKTRINRAKMMLVNSDMTTQEICEAVGISNVYYFSRRFKQSEGYPPGKFKRDNRPHQHN
jgi:AraC-like DNA-binding protein